MSKFKVGDVVRRNANQIYLEQEPDLNYWTATLVKYNAPIYKNQQASWEILTYTGKESTWSEMYFHKLTKLERALR